MQIPDWVDRREYPFAPHYLDLPAGRLHYVDEGQGQPLVFAHGTPTWSFLYRHLVKSLSGRFRCVAPDNLGFGRSDRPRDYHVRPVDHAHNLHALIEHLGLGNVTLVVHDFGGPIGLSYAIDRPENVRSLVLFNTWMWSLGEDASMRRRLRFAGGPIGQLLYRYLNFSARVIVKHAWGTRVPLTNELHRQYLDAFPTPDSRVSPMLFAREALGSGDWYDDLWHRRDRIADKPALLLWGLKDPAFGAFLPRWQQLFTNAETVTFSDVGHFPQEEVGPELVPIVARFLDVAS
ncbi:MAG: alpha/beta fold hydrolase [Chloroflexi bacterium]|nr:alpha/beta fold hydrolase [Chloroflexota bacterium]